MLVSQNVASDYKKENLVAFLEPLLLRKKDGVFVEGSFEDSVRSESVVLCGVLEDRMQQFQVSFMWKKGGFDLFSLFGF